MKTAVGSRFQFLGDIHKRHRIQLLGVYWQEGITPWVSRVTLENVSQVLILRRFNGQNANGGASDWPALKVEDPTVHRFAFFRQLEHQVVVVLVGECPIGRE